MTNYLGSVVFYMISGASKTKKRFFGLTDASVRRGLRFETYRGLVDGDEIDLEFNGDHESNDSKFAVLAEDANGGVERSYTIELSDGHNSVSHDFSAICIRCEMSNSVEAGEKTTVRLRVT